MGFKPIPAAVALALTLIIWFVIPVPQGVSPDAWHLLALFVSIIAGIIGKAMPIGAMAILGITLVALTGVTNEKAADATKDALSSLNNSLIWMIGIAIIISRGLLKTGLGMRIGYLLISLFGKRTLGIGYSLDTWKDVSTDDLFKGKKVVVFSLPGAFTPTCSSRNNK